MGWGSWEELGSYSKSKGMLLKDVSREATRSKTGFSLLEVGGGLRIVAEREEG